ncbi:unnamed protein product [Gadus morhua 'NCC']
MFSGVWGRHRPGSSRSYHPSSRGNGPLYTPSPLLQPGGEATAPPGSGRRAVQLQARPGPQPGGPRPPSDMRHAPPTGAA